MSEKEKLLQMVAEGKISVDDGERLLKAIGEVEKKEENEKTTKTVVKAITRSKSSNKNLKGKLIILVDSSEGDNVKINLPLKLANFAMT